MSFLINICKVFTLIICFNRLYVFCQTLPTSDRILSPYLTPMSNNHSLNATKELTLSPMAVKINSNDIRDNITMKSMAKRESNSSDLRNISFIGFASTVQPMDETIHESVINNNNETNTEFKNNLNSDNIEQPLATESMDVRNDSKVTESIGNETLITDRNSGNSINGSMDEKINSNAKVIALNDMTSTQSSNESQPKIVNILHNFEEIFELKNSNSSEISVFENSNQTSLSTTIKSNVFNNDSKRLKTADKESIESTSPTTTADKNPRNNSVFTFEANVENNSNTSPQTTARNTIETMSQTSTQSTVVLDANNVSINKSFTVEKKQSIDVLDNSTPTTATAIPAVANVITRNQTIESNEQTFDQRLNTETTVTPMMRQSMATLAANKTINESIVLSQILNTNTSDGNKETSQPLSDFRVFCTVGGWATYRRGFGRFRVEDLEKAPFVLRRCSHIIYAFSALNSDGNVVSFDPIRELSHKSGTFVKLRDLKRKHFHLKTLLALGGWDSPPDVFSYLVADRNRRQTTVTRITEYVKRHSFDGAVIAWFHPSAHWRSGNSNDRYNLVYFLEELNASFKSNALELGIMAPAVQHNIDSGFDIPFVSNLVDHLFLMTYDYFGSWDQRVNHLAPLYANNEDSIELNVNFTINYWISKGADPQKIVLGLATYGRSFTLSDPQNSDFTASAIGPGIPGPYTNRPGIIGFNEMCEIFLSTTGVVLNEDSHRMSPYIHLYDQWIGFEDELSLYIKTNYAIDSGLNGVFIWTLDLDDFDNICGWGHFPLLNATLQAVYRTKHF